MLIELLTPFMLATSPATLPEGPKAEYNHAQQRSVVDPNEKKQLLAWTTMTAGGTQTYDFSGKPYDNDSDQDVS
jgi:hypothetical protein